MTETAGFSAALLRRRNDARQHMTREFARTAPATVVLAFTGLSIYAAFATFGIDWAQLAGASTWEAAMWPIAAAGTTTQALYSRMRIAPGWHPHWVRWLFDVVAGAGFLSAAIGNGLHSGGDPRQLHPAVAVLVNGVPGLCLMLSVVMAAAFIQAGRPVEFKPKSQHRSETIGSARERQHAI